MDNRLTKEEFGIRQKFVVRVHANKYMSEGEILNVKEAVETLKKIVGTTGDCYRIEIVRLKENYNIRTGVATHFLEREMLPVWIAEEITNAKKIKQNTPHASFEPVITNDKMNVPAIKKGTHKRYSIGLKTNASAARPVPVATTITWHELTENDIVVNKDLKQIYPTVTGKMPVAMTKLLQHVR